MYDRHLPETALVSDPELVVAGALVRPKQEVDKDTTYRVLSVKGKKARIGADGNGKEGDVAIADLFVKSFGSRPARRFGPRLARQPRRPPSPWPANGQRFCEDIRSPINGGHES